MVVVSMSLSLSRRFSNSSIRACQIVRVGFCENVIVLVVAIAVAIVQQQLQQTTTCW